MSPVETLVWEVVREDDGYDLGYPMALHLFGHDLDLDTVENTLDQASDEEGLDAPEGWDLEETYVRKVPAPYGWRFAYTGSPGRGATVVTVATPAGVPAHWCWKHPFEPWASGQHISNMIDPPMPMVSPDGYLYMCRDCARDFSARLAEARRAALAGGAQ